MLKMFGCRVMHCALFLNKSVSCYYYAVHSLETLIREGCLLEGRERGLW